MNNYEKIKNMSVDEMAYFLYIYTVDYEICSECPIYHFCSEVRLGDCLKTHRQWLLEDCE